MTGPKEDLHRYLQGARDGLLWKLGGLSEYDVRRPLTPTGTNLLGLVKHLSYCELGYFGDTFGRPAQDLLPVIPVDTDPLVDMWATPAEGREEVLDRYRAVTTHADATIEELPLETEGRVPHWPEETATVTLHRILVHMLAETQRHLGHADIVRELIDGTVGLRADNDNMPAGAGEWWRSHRDRVELGAREAGTA